MARKVFVSSDMSNDERLIEVSEKNPQAALIWPWLLTAFDDWGRSIASPKRLKATIFPMIDIVSAELIEEALQIYQQVGLIHIYEVDGKPYMSIPEEKWYKYQTHMNRTNRRPGKDKMESDHPSPQDSPRGTMGDNGEPRGPVPSPSPSPSPIKDISTTTTREAETAYPELPDNHASLTIVDVHTRVMGNPIMSPLMSDFIRRLINSGKSEFYVKELLLEAGESSAKPSLRYLQQIAERWSSQGISSRFENRERKVIQHAKPRASPSRSLGEYDHLSV